MPATLRHIRIFISSPGDVRPERDALEAVISDDLQRTLGRQHNLYLEPLRWENLTRPGLGDIQSQVSQQMGAYDIFVGIFWKRFGTPTAKHESGSEEEFRDAYALWEKDHSRPVMMYFCEREANISLDTDPDKAMKQLQQAQKVKAFREEIGQKGLYWTYKEIDAFKSTVRGHLHDAIIAVLDGSGTDAIPITEDRPSVKDPFVAIRKEYLIALERDCQVLPLGDLGGPASSGKSITLNDVYVNLSTLTPENPEGAMEAKRGDKEEIKYLTAMEAAEKSKHMVLIGGPGSGKSTFVKQLTASLARERLETGEGPLPVFVTLRDLAPRLGKAQREMNDVPSGKRHHELGKQLIEQVHADLEDMQVPEAKDLVTEAFKRSAVHLVLDGLDEVPHDLRDVVHKAVSAVHTCFNLERVIVTCRIRSYEGNVKLQGYDEHRLAPFNEEQIAGFVEAWYHAALTHQSVTAEEAAERTNNLKKAAVAPRLRPLAEIPMLMTTMALVHQEERELPRERVVLYKRAVDILMRKWQLRRRTIPQELEDLFHDSKRLRQIMERLAFEAHHKKGTDEAADLLRREALELLEEPTLFGKDLNLAQQFLDYVDEHSGLLVGRGGSKERPTSYSFPHRTFQEYLAGCFLSKKRQAAREIKKLSSEGSYWSVAVQLGGQELFFNDNNTVHLMDIADALKPSKISDEPRARQALWSAHMAQVAGRAVVEQDEATGEEYLEETRNLLVQALTSELPAVERAEAGRLLAHLGDPRKELLEVEKMAFCYVPNGPFMMGSTDEDEMSMGREKPQHELHIPYDYWIGRYPVTVAQYQAFVDTGGYENESWWSKAGLAWKKDKDIKGLRDFGEPFSLPNHPVAGVSWYEALAYCRWLEALSKRKPTHTRDNAHYAALRSGMGESSPRRQSHSLMTRSSENPGGFHRTQLKRLLMTPLDGSIPGAMKSERIILITMSQIGFPCTPGCFAANYSPYGAEGMAGNVWDWTRSKWEEKGYPYPVEGKAKEKREDLEGGDPRVLRGGSFHDSNDDVRCAYRS